MTTIIVLAGFRFGAESVSDKHACCEFVKERDQTIGLKQPVIRCRISATGSTFGIGASIARRLNRVGFSVALHSRASHDADMRLVRERDGDSYKRCVRHNNHKPQFSSDNLEMLDFFIPSSKIRRTTFAVSSPALWVVVSVMALSATQLKPTLDV